MSSNIYIRNNAGLQPGFVFTVSLKQKCSFTVLILINYLMFSFICKLFIALFVSYLMLNIFYQEHLKFNFVQFTTLQYAPLGYDRIILIVPISDRVRNCVITIVSLAR